MIRPLRQRHRHMFAVLGVILPVVLVAGIAGRRPVPTVTSVLRELSGPSGKFQSTQWSRDDLFAKTGVHVALIRDGTEAPRMAFELSAPKNFVKPDLLVYWIAGNTAVSGTIPDNAVLLGSFTAATPLLLPRSTSPVSGTLVLYSLADHEIVDVSKPITL